VYVVDHVVNDKKKSIKHAIKEKAIAGCDKVFTDVVVEADNYVKRIDSTVKSDKVVSGDVDLIADDNKVIKLDDSISKFDERLLMAYISNNLGGNIGSKDELNYMHQLIVHGLINGVKLDYGSIIFNDLAALLTYFVHHTSPTYARFISLILEIVVADSYVLFDEIFIKIPIMGNSSFSLKPSLLEVPVSSYMVRVCKFEHDPSMESEDVASILLF
nr:hypothetical protein [Tanacetum cinerariifolium]